MSINCYQTLQKESIQRAELLGCQLPMLRAGSLTLDSKTVSIEGVLNALKELQPECGWVMTRSKTVILETVSEFPELNDLIEAEFSSDQSSLKIKLLQKDQYIVTSFTLSDRSNDQQCYKDQRLVLKTQAETNEAYVCYRLWWALNTTGVNKGRWEPLAQQFIGFSNDAEQAGKE